MFATGVTGAPVDTGNATVWLWSATPLVPGQRIAATGLVHAARGYLDPGSPDRAHALAARGADWEMTARTLQVIADDPGWVDLAWRWAARLQQRWAQQIAGDAPDAGSRRARRHHRRRPRRRPRRRSTRGGGAWASTTC